MSVKDDIRNSYRIVLPGDKIVVFRNPKDIVFGTMYVERSGNEIVVYGRPKKKNTNGVAKIFKIIRKNLVDDGFVSVSKLSDEIKKAEGGE